MVWWGHRGDRTWGEGVQATLRGLHTSLNCAGSGFLEAKVGPVHSNFLTSLLCRIQTEPISFERYQKSTIRGSHCWTPLLDPCAPVNKGTKSALYKPFSSRALRSSRLYELCWLSEQGAHKPREHVVRDWHCLRVQCCSSHCIFTAATRGRLLPP